MGRKIRIGKKESGILALIYDLVEDSIRLSAESEVAFGEVQKILKTLHEAGFVTIRKKGKEITGAKITPKGTAFVLKHKTGLKSC